MGVEQDFNYVPEKHNVFSVVTFPSALAWG